MKTVQKEKEEGEEKKLNRKVQIKKEVPKRNMKKENPILSSNFFSSFFFRFFSVQGGLNKWKNDKMYYSKNDLQLS